MKKELPNRNEVRATYESSRLSHRDIADAFVDKGYSISYKTIEKWCAIDGWKKNSYESFEIAIEEIEKTKDKKSNISDMVIEVLGSKNIIDELALNLLSTKEVAEKSESPQAKKIYQEMLLRIYDRIHDKKDKGIIIRKEDDEIKLEKPLEDMTMEELNELGKFYA